jgi:hypothetical protein
MILRLNLVVLWLALSAVQGATGSPSKIAITHVTVIDVRAGTIEKDMTVLIVGDRISAVRAAEGEERLPTKEITVIDGHGKYLIPGLWEMHIRTDGDDRALHLLIAYGITGGRDIAGDVAKLADVRRRITSGELIGPQLVFGGPMLEGPPSQADDWTWIIQSPEEARNAIDRLVELRVDFVKVHDGLARESYLAIAVASKERGISFVGHVPASMTPPEASDLGQKSIEHFEFVPKSCRVLFESAVGDALRAATLNPALFLGLSDSLGTIEVGKTASMVLLEANPLHDIRNTKRIVAVISEGRYLNREGLERLRRENCRKLFSRFYSLMATRFF